MTAKEAIKLLRADIGESRTAKPVRQFEEMCAALPQEAWLQ